MHEAAREFDIDHRTLSRKLISNEIKPDDDDKYSTKQICAAVFGNIQEERLRKTREEADNLALRNAQMRNELRPVEVFKQLVSEIILANRQTILASQLEQEGKNEILSNLQALGKLSWDKANKKK